MHRLVVTIGALAVMAGMALPGAALAQGEAQVRVWHASPDAPAVDVYVNGKPAFTNLAFPTASDYAKLPVGKYDVQVFPASAKGSGTPVIDVKGLDLAAKAYTVMAIGQLASIKPLLLEDNLAKPAAGKAHVRFVHASPDAPAVDITTKDGTKVFPNVAFGKATDWTPLAATTYDLQARAAGTETVALEVPGVALKDGAVVTVAATGLLNGTPALAATVVDYPVQAAAATSEMPQTLPQTGASDMLPLLAVMAGLAAIGLGWLGRRRTVAVGND